MNNYVIVRDLEHNTSDIFEIEERELAILSLGIAQSVHRNQRNVNTCLFRARDLEALGETHGAWFLENRIVYTITADGHLHYDRDRSSREERPDPERA